MPIIDIQRRLREAGRIRIGEQVPTKNGGTRPSKLDTFRFTSADKQSIMAIAGIYGGTPKPWEGAAVGEQFELYTDSNVLDVIVPPVDLAFSQFMELWSGGGCSRRCDGQTNLLTDSPCLCDPDNQECKPTTRLGVILTDIEGIGVWRLETHGWGAAAEINGAIEVLRLVQNRGAMVPARLMLEQRQSKRDGQTFNFAVPVLDLQLSVAALTAGASVPKLSSGVTPLVLDEQPALSIGEQLKAVETPVVKPPRANAAAPIPATGIAPRPAAAATPAPTTSASGEPLLTAPQGKMIARLFHKLEIEDRDGRLNVLQLKLGHPFTSSKELTKKEATSLISMLMADAGEEEKPRETPIPSYTPPVTGEPQEWDGDPNEMPF